MKSEFRFVLAVALMLGVLVGTNLLFPPAPPPEGEQAADTVSTAVDSGSEGGDAADAGTEVPSIPADGADDGGVPDVPQQGDPQAPAIPGGQAGDAAAGDAAPETPDPATAAATSTVSVESPLYRYVFTTGGARLTSARLLEFQSFTREGSVELVPEGATALGSRLVVNADTLDLRGVAFEVEPADGLTLAPGEAAQDLTFTYRHPTAPFVYRVTYTFAPDSYIVRARAEVEGLPGASLFTDLGPGLAFNEADRDGEIQSMAYVGNHLQEGITSWNLDDPEDAVGVRDGPFLWSAFKSKYFVFALLPGSDFEQAEAGENLIGGMIARNVEEGAVAEEEARIHVTTTQPVGSDGVVDYRLFMGPQDFARLTAIGEDLEDVNPYGWRFFRPVIRPLVGIVMSVLTFLHDTLGWGYGWVLIVFGIMMRVLMFPLYQKSMRAQIRNMAVQPLLKEIQSKYKDQPEKLQKEMMKLYKEHGFNPLAGCLPMLLPWPVLITLFFVFQNTIELRGVPFLWLPDLSAPDPLYILPAIMAAAMFLGQFISFQAMDEVNPQMKMMMWIMPAFMLFIFLNFAAGLNLYYATVNIAMLPQQYWIAQERKKAKKHGPPAGATKD